MGVSEQVNSPVVPGRGVGYKKVTIGAVIVLLVAGLGWLFDAIVINIFSLLLPQIVADFHGGLLMGGFITSMFLVGYTLGTFGGGILADYLGRKRTLSFSIVIYSIGMAVSAFAPTIGSFNFLRFLTGVGGGMELPTSAVYVAEVWPKRLRSRAMGLMHSFYPAGYLVAAGLAATVGAHFGWRTAFFACLVPGLLIFDRKNAARGIRAIPTGHGGNQTTHHYAAQSNGARTILQRIQAGLDCPWPHLDWSCVGLLGICHLRSVLPS